MTAYSVLDMEHARLAGFFDGEGSVIIGRTGKRGWKYGCGYKLYLTVGQLSQQVDSLHALKRMFGGRVHPASMNHKRPMSRWDIGGPNAAEALHAMFPYLRVKSKQAFVGMLFQICVDMTKERRKSAFAMRLTDDEILVRHGCYKLCRYLNGKAKSQGVAPVTQEALEGKVGYAN
jgi:hypothetical protein